MIIKSLPLSASITPLTVAITIAACCMTLTGCGYSHQELFPEDVSSITIPVLRNESFYRGVEYDLTEALVKEIELRCPYKVVDSQTAQTQLDGTIVSVEQRMLSRRKEGGMVQEMEVVIVIDFQWKDLRTGKTLRERKGFKTVGRYLPARPISQRYELAQHEAVGQTAQAVVNIMRSDW